MNTCPDGDVDVGEECDPDDANSFNAITQDCIECEIVDTCPDGDVDVGEECDPDDPNSFDQVL